MAFRLSLPLRRFLGASLGLLLLPRGDVGQRLAKPLVLDDCRPIDLLYLRKGGSRPLWRIAMRLSG